MSVDAIEYLRLRTYGESVREARRTSGLSLREAAQAERPIADHNSAVPWVKPDRGLWFEVEGYPNIAWMLRREAA